MEAQDIAPEPDSARTSEASHTAVIPARSAAWEEMKDMARYAVASGFLPSTIKKPEQAFVIIQRGKELGLPPMEALSAIHVIEGKTYLSAELLLALFLRRVKGAAIKWTTPPEKAHLEQTAIFSRTGFEPLTVTYTMKDAERAGLAGRGNWIKHPASMLRARVITMGCRQYAPDSVLGCGTPDEREVLEGEIMTGN